MKRALKKKIKYFSAFTAGVFFVISCLLPITVKAAPSWPQAPEISAKAAILMEASTGSILYEKEAQKTMFPASTTKLMTVLLALERCPLTDTVVMTHEAVYSLERGATNVSMIEKEQITMEDALYCILLASANEVAYAVGQHVAGGDIDDFVDMMNEKSKELGCVNSHYSNPHGLHQDGHYSCAYDLALVMKECLRYPSFTRISNNNYYKPPATNLRAERYPLAQTHEILRRNITYNGVFAGKTGHTDEAGYCLVTAAERDGMTLICVIMGEDVSKDAYTNTMSLFDYGFGNFEKVVLSSKDEVKNAFPVLFDDREAFVHKVKTNLSISDTTLVLPKGAKTSDITNRSTLTQLLEMQEGQNVLGEAVFSYAGREVGRADVIFTGDAYQIIDAAELYLRDFGGTDEFDERQYMILAGTLVEEEDKIPDLRPAIIGYIIGIIVLVIGTVILVKIYVKNRR
ncbi:MAG: D-alanyl-D-alanine carboxypeptidase [Lachnospiraceae bacterium]|nr:D-alanyl-D-alanine carboxypeptidase [Lachnospiraceae bacterium]